MVAPSRVGTPTIDTGSAFRQNISFSHTTTSDTDLLLVTFILEGAKGINPTPQFDGADLTLIRDTGDTGSNNDVRVLIYGMVSPGAVTANVTATYANNNNPDAIIVRNWTDTEISSVAAAANSISEDVNTSNSEFSVLSSGGVSGNTLYAVGGFQGEDGSEASWISEAFSVLANGTTGGSANADFAYTDGEYTTLPAGTTIDWNASDQNTGVLIELVAFGAGPSVTWPGWVQSRGGWF